MHVIAHWYNYERLVSLANNNAPQGPRRLNQQWPWEKRNVPTEAQPNLASVQIVSWYLWGHVQLDTLYGRL